MDGQNYRDEAVWRAQMLAGQAGVRQSINELGFLISGLFLAFLLSAYWPGLAIVVAAAMCGGSIFAVWRESRISAKMVEEITPSEAEQAN